ncbi:response regulator [Gracilibacillus sp. YIM 98692]|uniref:response regulator transcription factor n=1 Tax=Gracilibacillus sp. YIM 98692 TaxID=2663532 RepID=UPI0013D12D20|nr:response regulator [Gracilibacillus sp. YIM 98692]
MYKILLVDDEKEIRYGLKNYFPWNQLGFEVIEECENGKEALKYLRDHSVDVVLTDIRMPVMDGIELAKQIQQMKQSIQVIFLSGYKDFYYAKEAIKCGVLDYIVKPGKFEEIQAVFTSLKEKMDTTVKEHDILIDSQSGQKNYTENIIHTIKTYTQKNYADITLEDLASILKMSPNYISTYFKEKTGYNFSTYLTEVRMKKAATLLTDYHYKTYEISSLVGYNNPKNFTRMFKKYHGMTPREYRNRNTLEVADLNEQ